MRYKKNQTGITLVEVLATVVILSIVLIVSFSILTSSAKEEKNQKKEANQLRTTTLFLKMISKDFRQSTDFTVTSTNEVSLNLSGSNRIYKLVTEGTKKKITRNSDVIATNIGCLYFSENKNQLSIYISANPTVVNCLNNNKDIVHTKLLLRKGG